MIHRWALSIIVAFAVQAGAQEKSLRELVQDVAKIDRSIEVTRAKMKEVRDVAFVPELYFVLAELYVDKSRYLYTINRQKNPKSPLEELDFSDSQKAKKQAIETYQRFVEIFPKNKNVDKAYFFMAHEYRELRNNDEMIKIYVKITSEFPQSQFWEESQLILGDYYFEQKKDPRMAQDFYQKILERPPNPFMPTARYKLGWCHINQNKFRDAMLAFEGVITIDSKISLDKLPDFYKKSDVKRDALIALVWPYSEQKDLDADRANALRYFERLVPDRASMLKVFVKLSKRLMLKEKIDQAIPVLFRLVEISNELDTRISAIDSLYEALKKSKKTWPIEGLDREITKTLVRVRSSPEVSSSDKSKIEKNFEIYLRDFATQIQVRAKGTRSEKDYRTAIESYELYLGTYRSSRYAPAILLNLAETYFAVREYSRAGSKFEELVRRGQKKKDIYDSAVESYAKALKTPEKLSRLELTEAREGFRDVGMQFVKNFPGDAANSMILFNIARTYYDERDFDKAVVQFKNFVNSFPDHKEATTAGQLILDSFNQREDYEGMIKAGKELIANPKVKSVQFKKDVAEIVRQAEYRKLQDQAGDPKSRDYAKKLLGFAAKYQGTALGDQALYEAFVSLKAKKDPGAYDPGEQLLLKHGDSKYAKEVVGAMGQMALNTADYRRAAKYFETFARKFPKDPSSKDLLQNAFKMRDLMGDFKEGSEDARDLGQMEAVAQLLIQAQDWSAASQTLSARPSNSLKSNYWMGLALYRQGQRAQSRSYLSQASKMGAGSYDEKTMAAHALYLLASLDLKDYQSVQLGSGDEAALVKTKQAKLATLTQQMNTVIGFGNGRWTIAALYELGRAHEEFAQFISNASMPAGLTGPQVAQYKSLIQNQVGQFRTKAKSFFKACVDNAEKFEVFTNFVKSCQSGGAQAVDEAQEERNIAKASDSNPGGAASIRRKLFDSPRNVALLLDLSQVYLQTQDYAMARLIASRVLEVEPNNSKAEAQIGLCLMLMNDLEAAQQVFKSALKKNSREPKAVYGMAALYRNFGFNKKFQSFQSRLKSVSKPAGSLHPWMSGL